ncbi:MAG: hypothetical protein WC356_06400 [Candidatus Micrarchaeia archaeon]|jgi:hypothetical protein
MEQVFKPQIFFQKDSSNINFSNCEPKNDSTNGKIPHKPRGAKRTFHWFVNCVYGNEFKEFLGEDGHFKKGSNIFEDILIFSNEKIDTETQKRIITEVLSPYLEKITKKDIENSIDNLSSCGIYIKNKLIRFILNYFFSKRNTKLNIIIDCFGKIKTKNALIKFEKIFCGEKESLDKTLTHILNISNTFSLESFEIRFIELLELACTFNGTRIKKNYIKKGAEVIECILEIRETHPENEELYNKLLILAKKKDEEINRIFESLREYSFWEKDKNVIKMINKKLNKKD